MNSRTFTHRLELTFWATVIPLMSESNKLREIIAQSISIIHLTQLKINFLSILIIATLGWLAGFFVGFVSGLG